MADKSPPVVAPPLQQTVATGKKPKKNDAPSGPVKKVALRQLFRFADRLDTTMFALCIFLNAAQGAAFPAFAYILGSILTAVAATKAAFVEQVEGFCLYFLYIGGGLVVIAFLASLFGAISSERQANRIRVAYFKAMLRQDVGWFDVNAPGEVASRMQEDTTSVQGGINESIGQAVQYIFTFLIGLIIGFIRSWQLSLMILGFVPIMIIAGELGARWLLRGGRRAL
jgi:ATP-binding cassette, subfamily B (MDR/TAP), member 1